jgi:hypothetical protein
VAESTPAVRFRGGHMSLFPKPKTLIEYVAFWGDFGEIFDYGTSFVPSGAHFGA